LGVERQYPRFPPWLLSVAGGVSQMTPFSSTLQSCIQSAEPLAYAPLCVVVFSFLSALFFSLSRLLNVLDLAIYVGFIISLSQTRKFILKSISTVVDSPHNDKSGVAVNAAKTRLSVSANIRKKLEF
jgi:hypothetical protein